MASVRVSVNFPKNIIMSRKRKADHVLAIQAQKDTDKFVPALTGLLSLRTQVKHNRIVYPGPYARYLYGGKLMIDPSTGSSYAKKGNTKVLTDKNLSFTKAMHADAQDHWFEASKALNINKWLRVYGKAMKE